MNKYPIPTLNTQTPDADRNKLLTALRAVSGVDTATLHPSSSEIELTAQPKHEIKREDIASATSKVGFPMGPSA